LVAAKWYACLTLSWVTLIGFRVALVDLGWPPRNRLLTIGTFTAASVPG
jgi:hypothetical protein